MNLLVSMQLYILVGHLEVVPLSVALRVQVILEPQVVLDICHLGCLAQITVFEP